MKDMLEYRNNNHHDKKVVMNDLIRIIEEIASGWESQFERGIGPESLFGADQEYIPFQDLFVSDNGEILQDIQVSHLVDFLHKHLNRHELSK